MQGQNQTVNQPALNKRCNQLIGGDANDFVKDNSYEDDDKIKHRSSAGDKVYVDEETATDDNDRSKIGSGRFH